MANVVAIHNLSSSDEWEKFRKIAENKGWQHSALFKDMVKFYVKKGEDKK